MLKNNHYKFLVYISFLVILSSYVLGTSGSLTFTDVPENDTSSASYGERCYLEKIPCNIDYECKKDLYSNENLIQIECQNFPSPSFCPGGTEDIIVTGTDDVGCAIYGCKTEATCLNFPPPSFCPGGTKDIIVTGTDSAGCAIYGCKQNFYGVCCNHDECSADGVCFKDGKQLQNDQGTMSVCDKGNWYVLINDCKEKYGKDYWCSNYDDWKKECDGNGNVLRNSKCSTSGIKDGMCVTCQNQNNNSPDINKDGTIDLVDLYIIQNSWDNQNCPIYGCCKEDKNKAFDCNLDDDNDIDIMDIMKVASKLSYCYKPLKNKNLTYEISYIGYSIEFPQGWFSKEKGARAGFVYKSNKNWDVNAETLFGANSNYGCEGKVESVWHYDFNTEKWTAYDPQNPGFTELTTIKNNEIYSINIKEPCTLRHPNEGSYWKSEYCENGCMGGKCIEKGINSAYPCTVDPEGEYFDSPISINIRCSNNGNPYELKWAKHKWEGEDYDLSIPRDPNTGDFAITTRYPADKNINLTVYGEFVNGEDFIETYSYYGNKSTAASYEEKCYPGNISCNPYYECKKDIIGSSSYYGTCCKDNECAARGDCFKHGVVLKNSYGGKSICQNGIWDEQSRNCSSCGNGFWNRCDDKECTGIGDCTFQKIGFGGMCFDNEEIIIDDCSRCGNGAWNLCKKDECISLGNCEFIAAWSGIGGACINNSNNNNSNTDNSSGNPTNPSPLVQNLLITDIPINIYSAVGSNRREKISYDYSNMLVDGSNIYLAVLERNIISIGNQGEHKTTGKARFFISKDFGKTWQDKGVIDDNLGHYQWVKLKKSGDKIYISSGGNLYYTINQGDSWREINLPNEVRSTSDRYFDYLPLDNMLIISYYSSKTVEHYEYPLLRPPQCVDQKQMLKKMINTGYASNGFDAIMKSAQYKREHYPNTPDCSKIHDTHTERLQILNAAKTTNDGQTWDTKIIEKGNYYWDTKQTPVARYNIAFSYPQFQKKGNKISLIYQRTDMSGYHWRGLQLHITESNNGIQWASPSTVVEKYSGRISGRKNVDIYQPYNYHLFVSGNRYILGHEIDECIGYEYTFIALGLSEGKNPYNWDTQVVKTNKNLIRVQKAGYSNFAASQNGNYLVYLIMGSIEKGNTGKQYGTKKDYGTYLIYSTDSGNTWEDMLLPNNWFSRYSNGVPSIGVGGKMPNFYVSNLGEVLIAYPYTKYVDRKEAYGIKFASGRLE